MARWLFGLAAGLALMVPALCVEAAESLDATAKRLGLSGERARLALESYVAPGKRDAFLVFASGGVGGQVLVHGVPSMRLLAEIPVFAAAPGHGHGVAAESMAQFDEAGGLVGGDVRGVALSETGSAYDGRWLFASDGNTPRLAVIDLKDFVVRQVAVNPVQASADGVAVSPNSEYALQVSRQPAPLGGGYAPLAAMDASWRGAATFWRFDPAGGRVVPEMSFSVALPPYGQGPADFGKGESDGLAFVGSFCVERHGGAKTRARPPLAAGCAQAPSDFVMVIDWRKAAELVENGNAKTVNGHKVLPLDVASKKGALFAIPSPRNVRGVDVTPDGSHVIVTGKLDGRAFVYRVQEIRAFAAAGQMVGRDDFGVPVMDPDKVIQHFVEVGRGAMNTQFLDGVCRAVTPAVVESRITRWDYCEGKALDSVGAHFSPGFVAAMEGETAAPQGKWLVSLNRVGAGLFAPVGPRQPRNHQLISLAGARMAVARDAPVALGDGGQAVAVSVERLNPDLRFRAGWDSRSRLRHARHARAGQERVARAEDGVHVIASIDRHRLTPEVLEAEEGETVHFHVTNLEGAEGRAMGFTVRGAPAGLSLDPGETATLVLEAPRAGVYPFQAGGPAGLADVELRGYLLVRPQGAEPEKGAPQVVYAEADFQHQAKAAKGLADEVGRLLKSLTDYNYQDFPLARELLRDAKDQKGAAGQAAKWAEGAAARKDWINATLWAEQAFLRRLEAIAAANRCKTHLEAMGARRAQ